MQPFYWCCQKSRKTALHDIPLSPSAANIKMSLDVKYYCTQFYRQWFQHCNKQLMLPSPHHTTPSPESHDVQGDSPTATPWIVNLLQTISAIYRGNLTVIDSNL